MLFRSRLTLKLLNPEAGVRTVALSSSNLTFPREITLEKIDPRTVEVTVERKRP